VRQTLALEARLEDDRLARKRAAEESQSRSDGETAEAAARVRARLMWLLHPVDGEDEDDDWDEDLSDGPDDERGEGFVADRPAADVVAGVCGDLGIKPDLSLWTDRDSGAISTELDAGGAASIAFDEHREAAPSPPHADDARGRPPWRKRPSPLAGEGGPEGVG